MAAARRVTAQQGVEATTIAEIAAADLGFGTFYHYFESNEAIVDAVQRHAGRLQHLAATIPNFAAALVDATMVRLALVPAVMGLLGKASWGLPGWLERASPHLDVEGTGGASPAVPASGLAQDAAS